MNDRLTGWLTLSANAAVLVGIVLIVVELDQNRDSIRAQTRNEISTTVSEYLALIASDAERSNILRGIGTMASKLRPSSRRILEPAMAELGFLIRYPHFQRKRNGVLELVSLQHDKWGGGFFLEFAKHAAGDLETSWGELVPEQKINVAYTDPATRGRLLATLQHGDERLNYFRYDAKADDRASHDALVEELVSLLPQVVEWFETGSAGPNVSLFSDNSGASSA